MNKRRPNGSVSWGTATKRRKWLDQVALDKRFRGGAKGFALLLASRSDDFGKVVWGKQTYIAEQMGYCERSVRYWLSQFEAAGYLYVVRGDPIRDENGRFRRLHTNRYYFTIPNTPCGSPITRMSESSWRVEVIRSLDSLPKVTHAMRIAVLERDNYSCRYCECGTQAKNVDHVVPISRKGPHRLENLVASCVHCNQAKMTELWVPRSWTASLQDFVSASRPIDARNSASVAP